VAYLAKREGWESLVKMKESPVRVLLIGGAGRMGKTISDLTTDDPKIAVIARCDLGDPIKLPMKNCDVVIDFSHADAITEVSAVALQHRKPLVIGTTGQSQEQRRLIEEIAQSLPIVFSSNFSIGVNVLFWLTRKAAEQLGGDFDAEIVETHHKMKKDAPSGTAKTLAEVVTAAKKMQTEVPIQSIREGDVIGEHMIIFRGPSERLELTHCAESREIFARGALHAAQWVINQPPGLYSMQDVLGL
jgi:4-hydroxy-tetrahydrodipicolinate reductase